MYDIYEHLCQFKGIKTGTAVPADGQPAPEAGLPVSTTRDIPAGGEVTLAQVEGAGFIRRLFFIPGTARRSLILRIYWDGCDVPAVEAPMGDFFAAPLGEYKPLSSYYISRHPQDGLYCTFPMPFKKDFRLTVENISQDPVSLGYQIGWELCKVPAEALYFHAQFSLSRSAEQGAHTILHTVTGQGTYIGTSMLWIPRDGFSWNEGVVTIEPDEQPLLVGCGPDGYVGGSSGCNDSMEFFTPYSGFFRLSGDNSRGAAFQLYRWHLTDPICFQKSVRAALTAMGRDARGRLFQRRDDIASVAYFYLEWPDAEHMPLPSEQDLCVE